MVANAPTPPGPLSGKPTADTTWRETPACLDTQTERRVNLLNLIPAETGFEPGECEKSRLALGGSGTANRCSRVRRSVAHSSRCSFVRIGAHVGGRHIHSADRSRPTCSRNLVAPREEFRGLVLHYPLMTSKDGFRASTLGSTVTQLEVACLA